MYKKILIPILFISLLFTFTGCKPEVKSEEYSVIFNLMGGESTDERVSEKLTVTSGDTISLPIVTKSGYIFNGWTTHLQESMKSDFDENTQITSNIVLYAMWRRPYLYLDANGGVITKYKTIDEVINGFINDFALYTNRYVTAQYFFDASYGKLQSFLTDHSEWMGFINYLELNASSQTKPYFKEFMNEDSWDSDSAPYIRAEITAFLTKSVFLGSYGFKVNTCNYNNTALQNKVWTYLPESSPTFYTTEEDFELPTPNKEGYTFLGWCENEDLSDEPILAIKKGTTVDKKYYAMWRQND
ncbi:MAG: InlB B-repeat-containing protein [Bacilli bacterium]|nr:InlB B-repeat-containing protein [Bacilli bacterium]